MKTQHWFIPDCDRYQFDFNLCSTKKGWAQVDTRQDAWYYGSWCNPEALQVVEFAEGDVNLTEFESAEEFVDYLKDMKTDLIIKGIDPGLNPELKEKFVRIGAGDLLH